MLGDIYFRCKTDVTVEASVWWPVYLTKFSYIYVYGIGLNFLTRFTPENLPNVGHIMESFHREPRQFWLAKGLHSLEEAEKLHLTDAHPWIKIGRGDRYLSQILVSNGSSDASPDVETLADISLSRLGECLDQLGLLRYDQAVLGEIHGAREPLWG